MRGAPTLHALVGVTRSVSFTKPSPPTLLGRTCGRWWRKLSITYGQQPVPEIQNYTPPSTASARRGCCSGRSKLSSVCCSPKAESYVAYGRLSEQAGQGSGRQARVPQDPQKSRQEAPGATLRVLVGLCAILVFRTGLRLQRPRTGRMGRSVQKARPGDLPQSYLSKWTLSHPRTNSTTPMMTMRGTRTSS